MTEQTTETQPAPVVAEGAEGQQTERLYGGKYKTVEELEAAYVAAAAPADPAGNAGLKATKEAATTEEQGTGGDANEAAAADALKAAGLDQTVFTQEFAETGTISEESFKSLEKAGFPKELVGVYLDGLKARQSTYEAGIFAPAGGKDGYAKLLEWAGRNLEDADIDAFNAAVTSGDAARAKLAVAGLAAQAKTSAPAVLINGKASPAPGVQPYASRAEVQEAIRNPKYRSDPAYRERHMARLRASDVY
ncbi:capsid assembly protein [Xanthomonas campestris]|uniref:capsid assembly protein n=1 Tax=Xanthomonas campestris TaxID=339 RepID=UPI00069B9549|nr:hypothetical protein [Xanthomonas campestris]